MSTQAGALQRMELKYFLHIAQRPLLEADLHAFMDPDPHADPITGGYHLRSLYLDSPKLDAYHEKLAGLAYRTKLRLRRYLDGQDLFAAEIKRKSGNYIIKEKSGFYPRRAYARILDEAASADPATLSDPCLRKFRHLRLRSGARPVVLMDYERQAFFAKHDPSVRVSIDGHLQCCFARDLWTRTRPRIPVLHGVYSILEIKVNGYLPYWLHRLIQKYHLHWSPISKYCMALDRLYG